ncbi:MAG: FAD-dependent oxidoreductase [Oscillospiraceae bacterium]|nr:FAD-dependent oxidoreductase [Oscillospiraceae bacterium]
MKTIYDRIIIGAGLYGLYSAEYCGRKGENVLVLECDSTAFSRATYINQARVHMGYHYPRSISTAVKSRNYFDRFCEDYPDSIKTDFKKIYATSANFSWTDRDQFIKFCKDGDIPCVSVEPTTYFKPGMCDGTFETLEYTYDWEILRSGLLADIEKLGDKVTIRYNSFITAIDKDGEYYKVTLKDGAEFYTPFLLNSTYASVNQINTLAGFETFPIKYELCEIILCTINDKLRDVGITVMDGPFFSIMPFGKTGLHSLTSVTFTPHVTCYDKLPKFDCQQGIEDYCSPQHLGNCNDCPHKPESAWGYMSQLARKYLRDEFGFEYHSSLFSMKPILKLSEIDDSRPTLVKQFSHKPTFVSVLSGKINTVYDLKEVLDND